MGTQLKICDNFFGGSTKTYVISLDFPSWFPKQRNTTIFLSIQISILLSNEHPPYVWKFKMHNIWLRLTEVIDVSYMDYGMLGTRKRTAWTVITCLSCYGLRFFQVSVNPLVWRKLRARLQGKSLSVSHQKLVCQHAFETIKIIGSSIIKLDC